MYGQCVRQILTAHVHIAVVPLSVVPVRMHLAVHFKTYQNQGYCTYVARSVLAARRTTPV